MQTQSTELTVTNVTTKGTDSLDEMKNFIARIERLEETKAEIMEDIKQVYGEAEAQGFNAKILREIIRLRRKARDTLFYEEELRDLYMVRLGMK